MGLCAECDPGHRFMKMKPLILLVFLASLSAPSLAQSCISLSGSTQCPGFNSSSISTSPALTAQLYVFHPPRKLSALTCSSPFLAFVSNTQQFDDRLKVYTTSNYVQLKYVELLCCPGRQLTSTSGTSSSLAAIISISKTPRTSMPDIQPA